MPFALPFPLNRFTISIGVLVILVFANIIRFFCSGWGLVTIHAHEMPLGQVLKSIERQGWVTIYSDVDPNSTTVSMNVDKVPVAEAMETLVVNLTGSDANFGGAQWRLGFFVAPTSTAVKQEIRNFEAGTAGDDTKIYSFPTPLQMLATDDQMPASDPRAQSWAGLQPPPPAPPPQPAADGTTPPPADPPAPPSTIQDYLQLLAQQSDIWIMSPSSWEPHVSGAPGPSSSIIHAVKSLVGSANGAVEQAIVLTGRQRRGGGGGGPGRGFGGGDTGWTYMEDRVRSAINGLPPEARPAALSSLQEEIQFQGEVRAAPPDQRRDLMRKHFRDRIGNNSWRQSPEKRAQRYQQAVSNRQAGRGA